MEEANAYDENNNIVEGFLEKDNGYIVITDALDTYSQIYVTHDGGSTFSKIELPMELVKILPETVMDKGYTLSDYDYLDLTANKY